MRVHRLLDAAHRLRARLGLSTRGLLFAVLGIMTVAGSLAVFGAATEDVTRHNGMALHDAGRLRFFTNHRSDGLVRVAKLASDLGAAPVLALVAVLAGVLFWRRGLRLAVALAPPVAFGLSAAIVALTKGLVDRTRPPVSLHLVSESDASFPSGHSTDSAAVLVAIALVLAVFVFRRPLARALSIAAAGSIAAAIGASRLVLGVHWPSDVISGLALGLSIAFAVTMGTALVARLSPPAARSPRSALRERVVGVLTSRRRTDDGDLRAA